MGIYFLLISSYLIGSIPFGKIVGYSRGIDIQKNGSGNIGFANSLRVLGWKSAMIVLVADILKGYLPTYFSIYILGFSAPLACAVGACAIAGHIFSPWLRFTGGKGVATLVGATLAINPIIGLGSIVLWYLIFSMQKTASIASLLTSALVSLFVTLFETKIALQYALFFIVIVLTHRNNIKNLLSERHKEL